MQLAPELIQRAEATERRRNEPQFVVPSSGHDFDEGADKLTPPDSRRLAPWSGST
jgi:hypothetical protein